MIVKFERYGISSNKNILRVINSKGDFLMEDKNFLQNVEDLIPKINNTDYKRILAIGDVHGCFSKLVSLWDKISVSDDDLVIFLGDYVEGGDQNLNVLRWLMEQNKNVVILRGNMDDMFLDSFDANNPNVIFKGEFDAAEELYNAAQKEPSLVKQIHDFLSNTPCLYKLKISGRNYIFCHAGINIKIPIEKQENNKIDLIWGNNNFYKDYDGNAVIIVGHKSPRKVMEILSNCPELDTLKPVRIPHKNILLLDTRAKDSLKKEGYISCVDILNGEFWQS